MTSELVLLPKLALTELLEKALGHWFFRSDRSRALLRTLTGKVIAVRLDPPSLTTYLLPNPEGIQVQTECSAAPDVLVSGSPVAFARLAFGQSPREALSSGEVAISGDTRTAAALRELLGAESGMWQARLAGLVGPTVAGQLAGFADSARAWAEATATAFQKDVAEYLQEEAREVPAPAEGEAFLAAVDRLRDDCDRLEARLTRLRTASVGHASASD